MKIVERQSEEVEIEISEDEIEKILSFHFLRSFPGYKVENLKIESRDGWISAAFLRLSKNSKETEKSVEVTE